MKQRRIPQPDAPLAMLGMPSTDTSVLESSKVEQAVDFSDVQVIKVSKLRCSPYNSRHVRPIARIAKVAESLRNNGQKEPLYVYPGTGEHEGFFLVLGGETRRLAAIQLGLTELKAYVDTKLDPNDALALTKISCILNDSADECDLDKGLVVLDLLSRNYTQQQIADVLDLESRTHVIRLHKLASLPKQYLEIGREYPERFSASVGGYIDQAMNVHGDEFALHLLKRALVEEMPHRRIVRAIEQGPQEKASDADQARRLRRDGGIDIRLGGELVGKYTVYRSRTAGLKVLKFEVQLPDGVAHTLNEGLSELLSQFIASNSRRDEQS